MLRQGSGVIVNTASKRRDDRPARAVRKRRDQGAKWAAHQNGSPGVCAVRNSDYLHQPGLELDADGATTHLGQSGSVEKFTEEQPIRRPRRPEEVGKAVVWLCSDAASFVTGRIMNVDGGVLA